MINKSYSSLTDREAVSGASSAFRGWGFASFLLGAFSFIIGIAALPLRLILRKNIGERSIRPVSLILAIALHIYYFTQFDVLIGFISVLGIQGDPFQGAGYEWLIYLGVFILINPYALFLIWSVRRGVKHFKQKIKEAQEGKTGYTYYRGESRYFADWDKPTINGFKTNEQTIRMLGEPKAIFIIGLAIAFLSAVVIIGLIFVIETKSMLLIATLATCFTTGLVVAFDAICLAIDEVSLALTRRDKVLDMLDSEEDAKTIVTQKDDMKLQREEEKRLKGNPLGELSTDDDFITS